MLDDLLTWLTIALGESGGIALAAACGWGIISILLSPCHLSSIPLVIGYISSQGQAGAKRSFLLSFIFAIGILITIGLIGAMTAFLGRMMGDVGVGQCVECFVVGLTSWTSSLPWNTSSESSLKGARADRWRRSVRAPCVHGSGPVYVQRGDDRWRRHFLVAAFGAGHCAVIAGAACASSEVSQLDRPVKRRGIPERRWALVIWWASTIFIQRSEP
jgi:cytochrome c-type biogenesis protein